MYNFNSIYITYENSLKKSLASPGFHLLCENPTVWKTKNLHLNFHLSSTIILCKKRDSFFLPEWNVSVSSTYLALSTIHTYFLDRSLKMCLQLRFVMFCVDCRRICCWLKIRFLQAAAFYFVLIEERTMLSIESIRTPLFAL